MSGRSAGCAAADRADRRFIVATDPLGDLADTIMPGRRNGTTTRNIGNCFATAATG
jgi:hypothetical protein